MAPITVKHRLPALLILVLVAVPMFLATRSLAAVMSIVGKTERVSVSSSGEQGNGYSDHNTISTNGRYVVFASDAPNLVSEDTNETWDIFVRDRLSEVTERVSISSNGEQGNGISYLTSSISADGRFVAFQSIASNLVTGDTNGTWDIFVHDRQTRTTERVSVSSSGEQGNLECFDPSISADGRFVAFQSWASNLVSGDTNGIRDIFVHDRQTRTTERVSVSSEGKQGNLNSHHPSISSDGHYVAFDSSASNLVSGDTNGMSDIFVHNRQTGETERISVSSSGEQGNQISSDPSISADGRFVAFASSASNLVSNDTNWRSDVFVYDRQNGEIERVSVSSSGVQEMQHSTAPSISADGYIVAFTSYASNLVNGDTNGMSDILIYDRQTGFMDRVSISSDGTQSNNNSLSPAISADRRYVAFFSNASNLVGGDTNGKLDVFVHDRCPDGLCASTFGISGWIGDSTGADLADVAISVFASDGYVVANGTTGSDGGFHLSGLPAGAYRLIPNKISYRFIPDALSIELKQNLFGQNFTGIFVDCGNTTTLINAEVIGNSPCPLPFATPFLELPFDYSDFRVAAMGYGDPSNSSRVMSWFDHERGNLNLTSIWNGISNKAMDAASCTPRSACYNGHDGIDFNASTLPVKAADKGKVIKTVTDCSNGSLGDSCGEFLGNQVWIDHENGYASIYGHIAPDSIKVKEGDDVTQGQVIGTIGKSGSSTGEHLHFMLLFDANNDGHWDKKSEILDPYGWQPKDKKDPWTVPSLYLWKHPLYNSSTIDVTGGACASPGEELTADIPSGMSDGSLICSAGSAPAPAQPSSRWLRIIGAFFVDLWRMTFPSSNSTIIEPSATGAGTYSLNIAYSAETLAHLDASKLQIFHWDEDRTTWNSLPTTLDHAKERASTETGLTGNFTLQAPLVCPADAAEPNNDVPAFIMDFPQISYPYLTHHLFDIDGDKDWVAFSAEAGKSYTIQTQALASGVDTVLRLFGTDGVTELAADDNSAGGKASQLIWTASESGVYHVRVSQAAGSSFGCTSSYDLNIAIRIEEEDLHLFLPQLMNSQ